MRNALSTNACVQQVEITHAGTVRRSVQSLSTRRRIFGVSCYVVYLRKKKKVTSFLTYVEGLSVDKTLLNCYGIKVYSIRLLTLEDSNFLSLQYPGTSPTAHHAISRMHVSGIADLNNVPVLKLLITC